MSTSQARRERMEHVLPRKRMTVHRHPAAAVKGQFTPLLRGADGQRCARVFRDNARLDVAHPDCAAGLVQRAHANSFIRSQSQFLCSAFTNQPEVFTGCLISGSVIRVIRQGIRVTESWILPRFSNCRRLAE